LYVRFEVCINARQTTGNVYGTKQL